MAPRSPFVLRDLALPLALVAVIASGGFWLGAELDRQAEEVFDLGIEHAGSTLGTQVEGYAVQQQGMVRMMAKQTLPRLIPPTDVQGDLADWGGVIVGYNRMAQTLYETMPGYQALNWVSSAGSIELVWPTVGNEQAFGKNLNEHPDPKVRGAFLEALRFSDSTESGFSRTPLIQLHQGGLGYEVYVGVFDGSGSLLGVANAAFRVEQVIRESMARIEGDRRTDFQVRGPAGEVLCTSDAFDADVGADQASLHLLHVIDDPWTLEVRPTAAWLEEGLVLRGRAVQVIGAFLGLLLGAFSWRLGRRRRQVESDQRLQRALDGASLGVWDLDVPTGRLYLNDQWLTMLGYSLEEVSLDLAFYRSLVHPDDLIVVETALREHLEGRSEDYRTEHRLRSATGSWVWVLDQGSIVERDSAGRPLRLAGTQNDFSEVRRAELELERSVARYRAIFEHSPVGLLEQDMSAAKLRLDELRASGVTDLAAYFADNPEAIIEYEGLPVTLDINPAFLELFEAKTVAEYRENVLNMVDERARRAYEQELVALYSGARTCEVDFPLRSLAGEELLYTVRLTVAPDCQEDLSSVFVSLVDNTRILREEEERRLREARHREVQKEESLALLAGGVAHDFNNLLVPIIGNIELAMQDLPRRSRVGDVLLRAEQAAQRAAELARQMLTYSGRGQVKTQAFDLNALVVEMSALLASSLPGKVDLSTNFHTEPLTIEGDPTQLRQLVMNLVINGADAIGSEEGRVTVRTGRGRPSEAELEDAFLGDDLPGEGCAFLEVCDSGVGIDEETRKRIFEPFFSTKSAGRGLGMSVVLGIVRGHRGGLVVRSTPGEGTRIRAWFVERDAHQSGEAGAAYSAEASAAAEQGAPLAARVLLADDEVPVRRFTVRALESIGVEVVSVSDGIEAIEAFGEDGAGLDLAILDATMPRMGGIEAMEVIRERVASFPVVLSSGYTLEGVATRAARSEACWFLPKPYGVAELVRMVHTVLAEESVAEDETVG